VDQQDRWIECVSQTVLADLLLRAGLAEEAETAVRRGIELSDKPNRAMALALLARTELALGRPEDAARDSEEAFSVLAELGGIEDGDALVRLVRYEVLDAIGETDRALKVLAAARDRLLDRAAAIGEPDLRASFLDNVPDHARTIELARERLSD
jgi:tetratricopeptide (TPR) repeat protein